MPRVGGVFQAGCVLNAKQTGLRSVSLFMQVSGLTRE